jgi:hypothetical protein
LKDAALMSAKRKDEQTFRDRVDGNPEWKKRYGSAWDTIALVQEKKVADIGTAVYSMARLSSLALDVVRYARETARPDAERLEGFHDSQLESLRFRLRSPAPVFPEMDAVLLADAWSQLLERRGPDDPYINAALGGRPAAEVARDVTSHTKLGDPAFREALIEGGPAAIEASTDPFVALARRVEPVLRQQTLRSEQAIVGPETAAQQLIGEARFAAFGKTVSPDATFTLRLAFGTVKGYPMNGTRAPFKTTFHGLYDRALGFGMQPPYDVPKRLLERKDRIDMTTALNFVNTCDIIGGNSGSPVVNRNGELVGLIFDGNIESLVANFVYNSERGRAVAVHSAAIIEVLRKVYDADELADVLEARVATSRP